MVNNLGFPKFESFYILWNIALPIQVNAGFLFYVPLQNLRQFRTDCSVDNQRVTKSYENTVAFFVFVIFVPLSAYTGLFLQMNLHIQIKAVSLRRKINPLAPNNNIVKRIKS